MKSDLAFFGGTPTINESDIIKWPAPSKSHYDALSKVLESGRFHRVNHPIIEELEVAFSNWCRGLNVRAVATGTAAIHISLHYWNERNKKVIVSPLNWPGAIGPIFFCNMQPHFIDVSLKDACLSDKDALEMLNLHPGEIRIVLATHLFGNVNVLEKTRGKIRELNCIKMLDDCAQNIGFIQAIKAGTDSYFDSVMLSGNGSKHLGAGELGLICTLDPLLIEFVDKISLSSSSRNEDREFSPNCYGYNYRPNVFSGAIALDRISTLDSQLDARRKNSLFFWDRVKDLPGLLPLFDERQPFNSFCSLPLRIDNNILGFPEKPYIRDNIVNLLSREGVPVSVWLKKPVWEYMPYFSKEWFLDNFPNTKKILHTMFQLTQIAPPNDEEIMQLYVDAFRKVWETIPEIKDWLIVNHV